jgi:hypothetical protein
VPFFLSASGLSFVDTGSVDSGAIFLRAHLWNTVISKAVGSAVKKKKITYLTFFAGSPTKFFIFFFKKVVLFSQDNVDRAFSHFTQVLRLAPDHTRAKEIYRVSTAL